MHRVRRTRKSPSPSEDSGSSVGANRPSYSLLSGVGGSPILSHRTSSVSGVGVTSYAMYSRTTQVSCCASEPKLSLYLCCLPSTSLIHPLAPSSSPGPPSFSGTSVSLVSSAECDP